MLIMPLRDGRLIGDRKYVLNHRLEDSGGDVLAGFQPRGRASLDQMAVLLGFPGKLGMSGDKVWDKYQEGGIREIRDYCETDVLNTWLCFLRFEFMRGNLDKADLEREYKLVRSTLETMDQPHLNEFLAAWPA